jgi:hypothetical protein
MEQVASLSRSLFNPYVGEEFELVMEDGPPVPVRLEHLADRGGAPHSTMFSLYFLIPHGGPQEQGLFRLQREGLGAVELLLVPVRRDGESVLFEAAINLLGSDGE